jgi:predicted transcriptional regulator
VSTLTDRDARTLAALSTRPAMTIEEVARRAGIPTRDVQNTLTRMVCTGHAICARDADGRPLLWWAVR